MEATRDPRQDVRDLTPAERITAAYLIVVRGVQVQDVAVAFNVNLGRVSEAMKAIGRAASDPRGVVAALAPKEPEK